MLTQRRLLLLLALLGLIVGVGSSARAQGNGPLILDNAQSSYPLGLHLEYLEDSGGELTIDDVSGSEFTGRFTPSQVETLNFGVTQSVYWIRLRVRNQTSQVSDWRLAFTNARMGLIDLYALSPDNSVLTHQQAGSYLPATVREYAHPHFVFPVSIAPSNEALIYLRLQSNLPMRFSLSLWEAGAFEQYNHVFFGFIGFFYGIVAIMLVYNLLLYLFLRRVAYLYYVLFILFYTLNTAASDGTAHLYLFPNISLKYGVYGFATLTIIFSVLFIREFLELKWRLPWLSWTLVSLAVIQVLSFALYGRLPQLIALTSLIVIIIAILAILGGLLVWRQGLLSARYFLLGWLGLLLNAILLNSTNVAIIQNYPLFDIGQYISTILLVTFLSLALADQINVLRTQAIQAESAMQESEERFRATFEQAAVGIANVALDGHFLRVNQRFCDIVGYTRDEMLNLTFQGITYPDDLDADLEYVAQLNAGLIPTYSMEKRYFTKDGRIVWVNLTVSLLWKENGKPDYAIAVVENITERKQIEQALNESELKYRTLVEQANAGIIVVQEGKIIFANSFAEELSGYSVQELLNTPFISYIVEDEQPRIFDLYQRRMAGEDIPEMYETAFKRRDGSRLEVEINAGITLYNGKPSNMVLVRDITERKWMETQRESVLNALDESERKYRTLVEHANDGIAVIQYERIVFANLRLAEILGCTFEDLKDTPFVEYLPADEHSFINDVYQRREEKDTPSIYGTIIQRRDGSQVPVEFSASLTTYASEEAVLVFIRDITERKRAEDALQERKERYRQALESGLIVLWQWDRATDHIELDGAVEKTIGYAPDEIDTGAKLASLTPPEEQVLIQKAWGDMLEGRSENYNVVHRLLHKDGSVIWVEANGSVVKDEQGQVISILGTSRDITATRQAEELVARSQAVGQVGSWELDLASNQLTWSDEVYRIFGLDLGAVVPTYEAFLDHVHPEDRAVVDAAYSGSIREGKDSYETEHRLVRPATGEIRWVLEKCDHLRDESGQIVRSIGVVQDITERRKTEEALYQSREQLAILNRASQTINMAGLDSEQVYIAVRAACAWLVPADVVVISLVDYAAGEVEDVYVMDRDRHLFGNRHPLNGSFIGEVLANGFSVRVDDFHTRPNSNQYTNWIKYSPNTRSGMAVVLRGSEENLGVLTVQSYTPDAYTEDDQSILESFAAHASITLENIRHYKQLEKAAVIEERQRLASDLHDSVTQLLYSIALMSGGWRLKASQDELPAPAEHFHQIEDLSLQALKELRMLIHQLRPPVLAEVGLLKALEDRLERVERRVEIQASIHIEGKLPRLTALVEEELYFMILEALNNSLRHARASSVQIDIHAHEKQLHIFVVDNGRGYDTSLPSKGMGTAILQNRAAAIGAKVTSHSQPGQGTRVDLLVGI